MSAGGVRLAAGLVRLAMVLAAASGCAQVRDLVPFLSPAPAAETAPATPPATTRRTGRLLLSGGVHTAGAVIAEAARVTGGAGTKVLVFTPAGTPPKAARAMLETWEKAGFTDVELLDTFDAAHAAAQIEAAKFLWMDGPSPARLVAKLTESGLDDRVRARFESGAIVGGANAGASAVAELMLAGAGDDGEMQQDRVDVTAGLGLWRGVIVDEHFVAKKRFNRLMAAVLDHPAFVGVGIDEGTGVVVEGGTMRVVGDGNVVVIDARHAKVNSSRPGDASAATGVEMQILAAGMTYDLGR